MSVGAAVLHAFGGALFYFTPRSILSPYAGIEYWYQVTQRATADPGSALAKIGIQGALSSRASFYVEGGLGIRLRRGDKDELLTRIVGQIGLRMRL